MTETSKSRAEGMSCVHSSLKDSKVYKSDIVATRWGREHCKVKVHYLDVLWVDMVRDQPVLSSSNHKVIIQRAKRKREIVKQQRERRKERRMFVAVEKAEKVTACM